MQKVAMKYLKKRIKIQVKKLNKLSEIKDFDGLTLAELQEKLVCIKQHKMIHDKTGLKIQLETSDILCQLSV